MPTDDSASSVSKPVSDSHGPIDRPVQWAHARTGVLWLARQSSEIRPERVAIALPVAVGWHAAGWTGAAWGAIVALFYGVVPAWQAPRAKQQPGGGKGRRQVLAAAVSLLIGLVAVMVGGAPRPVLGLAVGLLAILVIFAPLTTRGWNISTHSATASGAAAVLIIDFRLPLAAGVAIAAGAALVAISRIVLGEHDLSEVLAGLAVGAVACGGLFALIT
ncbi:hypothetical protein ACIBHX_46690 [Nonomuraea sp. NPDC050536]|uniref:hypothetical protein n=1 Tax=Nonomuraea sp. NPDC050536 TaxID=3364366 RepID=UPI0037C839E9